MRAVTACIISCKNRLYCRGIEGFERKMSEIIQGAITRAI